MQGKGNSKKLAVWKANTVCSCPVCNRTILENPQTYQDQSIGCDYCNEWYHYKCVSQNGNVQTAKKTQEKKQMK